MVFSSRNDCAYLEYDSPRSGSFAPLRFVPKGKKIVLGRVTTKTGEMETADEVKRRIDEAARYVPLEQLALSPRCGFSSTVLGNNLTIDAEIAKLSWRAGCGGKNFGAGDGDRTRDVQLGKLAFYR